MTQVNVTIKNLDKFLGALNKAPTRVAKHLQSAIETAGYSFQRETKSNIRSGRDMWKAPIDTGYMWNHIFLTVTALRAEIIPTANYAIYVHQGTGRMRARPFLEITMGYQQANIDKIFENELTAAMREIALDSNV